MESDIKEGLTIIIPSKTEKFLRHTILDVLKNADGPIEIFPILDGYDVLEEERVIDDRVKYVKLEPSPHSQKRQAMNLGVSLSKYKFVMSLDAHCMVAPGFDTVLKRDWQETWVMVPRRHRLDAENWCIQIQPDGRPPIDYEYLLYPLEIRARGPREPKRDPNLGLHGFKWDARSIERKDIPIDENMTIQGSIWFMSKDWFHEIDLMQIEGFTGWGNEGEEIAIKTWLYGGKVMTDKNTWYAHLHKGNKYGRMYHISKQSIDRSNAYAYDFWMNHKWSKRKHDFDWLIDKFSPPKWPSDWRKRLNYVKHNIAK